MRTYPDLDRLVDIAFELYIGLNPTPYRASAKERFIAQAVIYNFSQVWSSTALGFNGFGGSAITRAITTVITKGEFAAVFFADELAYMIPQTNDLFQEHLKQHSMSSCCSAAQYRRNKI